MNANVLDRFFAKVSLPDENGCRIWLAAKNPVSGYGVFRVGSKVAYAHRVAYELLRGPIPDDLEIDHLCRVRACVNTGHLEAVPGSVNTQRAMEIYWRDRRGWCRRGHELTPENSRPVTRGNTCRICERARWAAKRRVAQ